MIVNSTFKPAWWMRNPHLQTILPRIYRRRRAIQTIDQPLELPDGDFVELCWSEPPNHNSNKPLVILFHGLAGSIDSVYANGMMKAVVASGWQCVLMHFRGCGKHPNRLPKAYHSGATEDADYLIRWLHDENPTRPLAAIGFSLGGNMLAKYLGEKTNDSLLDAAVVVSAPLLLSPCAQRMTKKFSRVYQRYLLGELKASILKKIEHLQDKFPIEISKRDILAIKTLKQFDDLVTSPLHGFNDAEDYYARSSGLPFLRAITTPTLVIHAADDPFMTHHVKPRAEDLSQSVVYELSQNGGHLGFLQGRHPFKPQFWLEQRVPEFLSHIWQPKAPTQ